jgi:hypothetical protein
LVSKPRSPPSEPATLFSPAPAKLPCALDPAVEMAAGRSTPESGSVVNDGQAAVRGRAMLESRDKEATTLEPGVNAPATGEPNVAVAQASANARAGDFSAATPRGLNSSTAKSRRSTASRVPSGRAAGV